MCRMLDNADTTQVAKLHLRSMGSLLVVVEALMPIGRLAASREATACQECFGLIVVIVVLLAAWQSAEDVPYIKDCMVLDARCPTVTLLIKLP